ncbi:MAG: helix-hairpin-helix domain-containing protein [Chloroflexi bacterium]|nr:helix-hairpin-helix domain-containing protein [Chloroflexota bacterium]
MLYCEYFPIELNRASKEQLLRIPGIGPTSVNCILQMRRMSQFNSIEQLARIGADEKRAAPFVLLNGKAPIRQLALL